MDIGKPMKKLLIILLLVTFNAYADCVPSYIAGSSGCGSRASVGSYDGNAYNRAVVRENLNVYLYDTTPPPFSYETPPQSYYEQSADQIRSESTNRHNRELIEDANKEMDKLESEIRAAQ